MRLDYAWVWPSASTRPEKTESPDSESRDFRGAFAAIVLRHVREGWPAANWFDVPETLRWQEHLALKRESELLRVFNTAYASTSLRMPEPLVYRASSAELVGTYLPRLRGVRTSSEESHASTVPEPRPGQVDRDVEAVFAGAREEVFEDGMESEFSLRLARVVDDHGKYAIEVISHIIAHNLANSEVCDEALRWMGLSDDKKTHAYRLWVLRQSLSHPSMRIRDAAVIGLALMEDVSAAGDLRKAAEREACEPLKEDMTGVLRQLEGKAECHTT